MSWSTKGARHARLLIGLCAAAFALQGAAAFAVDLPGCVDLGSGAQAGHVHAADDHPEGDRGLLALPSVTVSNLFLRLTSGSRARPTPTPLSPLLHPPRAI
jgi:hypothetical protein